jgi:hypothetical protein
MCGKSIAVEARKCRFCGETIEDRPSQSDNTLGGLIPVKNPQALAAYYLGLFSLLPCFPIGIAAFFLGLRGLRNARENPAVRGTVHAWIGVLMGGFCGLLWLALTVLICIAGIVANNQPR